MIEGLKIELTTDDLRAHLFKREMFHTERAAFYGRQVENLNDGGVGETQMSNDPRRSLSESRKSHGERAEFFKFLKDHLIPNETYRLSENDFSRLEFASRYF